MDCTITFCQATVKELTRRLHAAYRGGNAPLIKRLHALLLLAERRPVTRIAECLGVCKQTIYNWLHAFVLDRYDSLPTRRPPGRPAKLTAAQRQRLCELIDGGPEAAGYRTGCWNTALIQTLIQREFQRCYNVHYLAELLRHLGYSYQKARFVSDHLDEARRQHWLMVIWPAIVQQARQSQALLLFGDEASFAQWGSLGYSWAKRGHQPLVKTTGKRKGYKVLGLIEYFTGQLFYQGQTERLNAERYCAFLVTVLESTEQPVLLIQDGARYHTARATQAFVAQHAERLQVYQLPSYSPDYNPIEHLWRNVKREQTHNRYFPTFESLTQAVEESLAAFLDDRAAVKQLMGTHLDRVLGLTQAA